MGLVRRLRLLTFVACALAPVASAQVECAWAPVCLPPYDPPIDRVRIYLDDQPTYDHFAPGPVLTPYFQAGGKRAVFWICGRPEQVVSMSVFRGSEESPRAVAAGDAQPPGCTPTGEPRTVTVGSLFTPTERAQQVQARCAASPTCSLTSAEIAACQGSPTCAIDVNSDGAINDQDTAILERVRRGELR